MIPSIAQQIKSFSEPSGPTTARMHPQMRQYLARRRKILELITKKPMRSNEVSAKSDIPLCTVHIYLNTLQSDGLATFKLIRDERGCQKRLWWAV